MNDTRKSGAERDGLTKEELVTFREESLHAINGVKRRLHRERVTRGVLLSGAAAAVVILAAFFLPRLAVGPEAIAPQAAGHAMIAQLAVPDTETYGLGGGQDDDITMIARLVVPDAETDTLQVFRASREDESGGIDQMLPLKLRPILDLQAGDTITVAEGETAVLYNWMSQTREKFSGPCELKVTNRGVKTVRPNKRRPETEQARLWAMSLEPISTGVMRTIPHEMPQPIYPVDTSVFPGEVSLRWEYSGHAGAIELTVENKSGDVLLKQELSSATGDYSMTVNEGSSYYWKVAVPGEKAPVAQEFHVLHQSDWEWVKDAVKFSRIAVEDLISGDVEITNQWDLSSLYEILMHYQLYKEAEIVRQRLQDILSEE